MGYVNTQVTLKNFRDVFNAKKGNLPEDKIRQTTVDVMVDTGASTLVINEKIFQQLGLDDIDEREITLANDAKETCKVTEPLVIKWEDRAVVMSALVIEGAPDFLLGVLPLEGMDLIIDTVNQKLVGAHGKKVVYRV
jgi:clan AA aspartic protease